MPVKAKTDTVGDVRKLIARLDDAYPDAKLDLDFTSPFELLIALILAAQCTDDRVNAVTSSLLFSKYRTPQDYVAVAPEELERDIASISFFRSKARSIRATCERLIALHDGTVPSDLAPLLELHGVGRKTANVLRANAFGIQAIGVDTHVGRLARRLGLSTATEPDRVEADLTVRVPQASWTRLCHLLQAHGRRVCESRKPRCWECPIADLCPYDAKTPAPVAPQAKPAFGRRVGARAGRKK